MVLVKTAQQVLLGCLDLMLRQADFLPSLP